MKTKHYPLLTAALGAALILVPGILLLVVLNSGGDAETNAVIDQALTSTGSSATVPPSGSSPSRANNEPPRIPNTDSSDVVTKPPVTQVASARGTVSQGSDTTSASATHMSTSAAPSYSSRPTSDDPQDIMSESPSVPNPVDVDELEPILPQASEDDADAMPELIEIPRRPVVADSYYDATGHLAMAGQGQVADPLVNAPVAVLKDSGAPTSKDADAKSTGDSKAKDSKRGSSRRRGKKDDVPAADDQSGDNATMPVSPSGSNPFLSNPAVRTKGGDDVDPALIEDIVINTPAENQQVNRVEDVVATTVAKGWPIALIRSDLPDDVWWVQQVIGIQGNSFGARVNFGNEYTVRGSAYRMVIVFLDSPDEVRRFRIAKQFKEIPAGVRRSREFHYIRK